MLNNMDMDNFEDMPAGALNFLASVTKTEKERKEYYDLLHDIHLELERDQLTEGTHKRLKDLFDLPF